MAKSNSVERDQAQYFNPLIGISSKDTADTVALLMRSMAQSDLIDPKVMSLVCEVAAAALEFECSDDGDAP